MYKSFYQGTSFRGAFFRPFRWTGGMKKIRFKLTFEFVIMLTAVIVNLLHDV